MKNLDIILKNIQSTKLPFMTGIDGVSGELCTNGVTLLYIFSYGGGWEHVSVSTKKRCPTWSEMCFVKDFFFNDDECVMQLYPAKDNYVNNHKNCLHIWKPVEKEIPIPPKNFV
jgi:hypothetical protein